MDDRWLAVGEFAEYLGIKFKRSEMDERVHQGKALDAEKEDHDE